MAEPSSLTVRVTGANGGDNRGGLEVDLFRIKSWDFSLVPLPELIAITTW